LKLDNISIIQTAIHIASQEGMTEAVQLLLQNGANINEKTVRNFEEHFLSEFYVELLSLFMITFLEHCNNEYFLLENSPLFQIIILFSLQGGTISKRLLFWTCGIIAFENHGFFDNSVYENNESDE
jgi:hypothetical protein